MKVAYDNIEDNEQSLWKAQTEESIGGTRCVRFIILPPSKEGRITPGHLESQSETDT